MNEEIKTTVLVLISPVLFFVLGFILKKMFQKFEDSQKLIAVSISELKEHVFSAKSEINLMSLAFENLKGDFRNQNILIQKEVDLRNKRLDRHSDLLIKSAESIAVIESRMISFEKSK